MLPSTGGCGKHPRVVGSAGIEHQRAKQRQLLTFRKRLLPGVAALPSPAAKTSRVSRLASSGPQLSKTAAPTIQRRVEPSRRPSSTTTTDQNFLESELK